MLYADIIIFALIAVFVLLRLRSILGDKTGFDPSQTPPKEGTDWLKSKKTDETVIDGVAEPVEEDFALLGVADVAGVKEGLEAIRAADGQFSLVAFLEGAKAAYEMVFDAFANGQRDNLKLLLSDELYTIFNAELDKRQASGRHEETTLLALNEHEVVGAEMADKKRAHIRVKFISEQVTVVRDNDGKVIEGDPSAHEVAQDEWLFERDVSSRNPNWTVVET